MTDEQTSEIAAKTGAWLLGATGAAWLAAAQGVGLAIVAALSERLSKEQLVYIIGAQALSLLAFLLLALRAFARQGRALSAAKISRESATTEKKKETLQGPPVYPPLDAKCLAVLRFLANKSSGAWAAHVGYELKYSIGEVEFCFDRLRERRLIRQVRADAGSGAEYGVTPEGRVLLYEN